MAYLDDLHSALGVLTRTREHADAAGFIARNRAIDELEVHLFELTHDLRPGAPVDPVSAELTARVGGLRDRLQRLNDTMAQRLRERIATASISPRELRATLQQYVRGARHETRDEVLYDDLDVLVAAVFAGDQAVDDTMHWHPEMVRYQPTPARLILSLIQEIRPSERDVFVDLGSGMGTVPTLVSLLTGARAVGVEWHPSYCAQAQRCVRDLNLSSVSFLRQDARQADLTTGTIFYMFTPCKGAMLRDILRRLDREGRRRALRLCVHGPLLREAIAELSSFSSAAGRSLDQPIAVFQSRPVR